MSFISAGLVAVRPLSLLWTPSIITPFHRLTRPNPPRFARPSATTDTLHAAHHLLVRSRLNPFSLSCLSLLRLLRAGSVHVQKHTPLRRLATLASSSGLVGGRLQAGLLLPAAGRASSSSTLPSQLVPASSSSAIPRSSSLIQHARTFSTPPPLPPTPSPTSLTPPVPPTKPRSLLSKIFRLGLVFNALSIILVLLGGGSLWVYYSYVVPAKTVYKRGKDGLTYAVVRFPIPSLPFTPFFFTRRFSPRLKRPNRKLTSISLDWVRRERTKPPKGGTPGPEGGTGTSSLASEGRLRPNRPTSGRTRLCG